MMFQTRFNKRGCFKVDGLKYFVVEIVGGQYDGLPILVEDDNSWPFDESNQIELNVPKRIIKKAQSTFSKVDFLL